jgi:hypothetical protein
MSARMAAWIGIVNDTDVAKQLVSNICPTRKLSSCFDLGITGFASADI